jgi:hypothetical protein
VTIFLVILAVVGWLLAIGGLVLLGILSLAFSIQEARLNEIKSDLEVMTRRANLFQPKGEHEDI